MEDIMDDILKMFFILIFGVYISDVIIKGFILYWQSFSSPIYEIMIMLAALFTTAGVFSIYGNIRKE